MDQDFLRTLFDLEHHLAEFIQEWRGWGYAVLFGVIVAETGLVIFSILPGDSLLFTAGALAARNQMLDIRILLALMTLASFTGDQVNYLIGRILARTRGGKIGGFPRSVDLERAKRLFESKGGQAVIIGRFIPVIRSIVPLTAAISGMPYSRFVMFSLSGTALWTWFFLMLGYFFGKLPLVRDHFSLVVLFIAVLSLAPGAVEYLMEKRRAQGGGEGKKA